MRSALRLGESRLARLGGSAGGELVISVGGGFLCSGALFFSSRA